ncbi:MAG: RING-HC finger protein [bacterium]
MCLEPELVALALVPCGHQVCRGCWEKIESHATIESRAARCPLCREDDVHGVHSAAFPDSTPLRQRFCVEMPTGRGGI